MLIALVAVRSGSASGGLFLNCMEYKSSDELLAVLQARGLEISDPALALHFLDTVGHHRLSTFYTFFYSEPKVFDTTIPASISDILHLYSFDRRLRLLLMGPLEKIEVALRALIIKELGDHKKRGGAKAVHIDLFDEQLYDLSTDQNRNNFEIARDACRRSANTHWLNKVRKSSRGRGDAGKRSTRVELDREFNGYYASLPAWEILKTASFGPLTHIFSVLRPEIAYPIAARFGLPRVVLTSILYSLKELRNACAHHEPIWNWDARFKTQLKFPKTYTDDASVNEANIYKLYSSCAVLHILLAYLSNGGSTWYRRLKKLINEFNTIYCAGMGFPNEWQTMPFWCVTDVRKVDVHAKLQRRLAEQSHA